MGDHGSSDVHPPAVVTPSTASGPPSPRPRSASSIRTTRPGAADGAPRRDVGVAIVVVGYDATDEGEYIGPDAASRPELLALFPPIPQTAADAAWARPSRPRPRTRHGGDRRR